MSTFKSNQVLKQSATIPANSTATINFGNTMPNYFRIYNGGDTPIYFGLEMLPDANHFDKSIPPKTYGIIGTIHGYYEGYIFNGSTSQTYCTVESFPWTFDPLIMAMGDVRLAADSTINTDGIVKGFSVPLPTGNNNIGNVGIGSALPAGTNTIGKVIIDGTITTALETDSHGVGTVNTTASKITVSPIKHLLFFSNDSATISIFIGKSAATADLEIKPGEVINDLLWIGDVYAKAASTTAPYRAFISR